MALRCRTAPAHGVRVLALIGALALPFVLSACSGAPSGETPALEAGSPTGGWAVILDLRHPQAQQYVHFDLSDQGRLIYTAGMRAMPGGSGSDKPTWSGTLTADELRPLVVILQNAGEIQSVDTPEGGEGVEYRASLKSPGALFPAQYRSGPTPFFDALYAELQRVQSARRAGSFDLPVVQPRY